MNTNIYIDGYKLKLGSFACPEAYDVFDPEGNQVAYFKLRHGKFNAYCPDYGSKIVYSATTIGDGVFQKNERMLHLRKAMHKVQEWIIDQRHEKIE